MRISTASLSLSLLTLALTSPLGGCYTYEPEEEPAPFAGMANGDLVASYLEDAYFELSYPDDGPTREAITYHPGDGQICMALRETLTPLVGEDGTPDPSEDPTVDDGRWIILSAQVDSESLDDGSPQLRGGVFWYDDAKGWRPYGTYRYAPEDGLGELELTTFLWPVTLLKGNPTNVTALQDNLPPCGALRDPEVAPGMTAEARSLPLAQP